jgi:putative ABC transport system permease protein
MKDIITLALKNVWRYRRRTILTFLVLAVGLMLYIFMVGMYAGLDDQTISNLVDFQTGHLRAQNRTLDDEAPFSVSNFISNPGDIIAAAEKNPEIVSWAKRVKFPAEADNGIDATPCMVTGIDPDQDHKVFNLTNFIVSGSFSAPAENDALIGTGLAKDLGLKTGDPFFLTFRNGQGMIDSIELNVSGVINAPDPMVNGTGIFIRLRDAAAFLNNDGVSEISFRIRNREKDLAVLKSLGPVLEQKGVRLESWKSLSSEALALANTKEKFTNFFIFFLVIIAIVGIVNTMLMSVYEKTREIGTLKALGMRDRDVRRLFLAEGMVVGVLGGVIGVLLGSLLTLAFAAHGMDFTSMIGDKMNMSGTNMALLIYPRLVPGSIIGSLVMSLLASLFASWMPANKAVGMQAAECLRTI